MQNLRELTKDIEILQCKGDIDTSVSSISINSKKIEQGSLFVALAGNITDGHLFIDNAVSNGAIAIVYEKDIKEYQDGVIYVKVADSHEALAKITNIFYGEPSKKLKLVGVTGTNGKTTTATLLHQLFRNLGYKAGMIGTVVNKINDKSIEAERTTPDPITLNKLIAEMVAQGCEYCFMEVSSHAVVEKRILGLIFVGGVFTNLTHDHLDYHKTFENYRDAKKAFFDNLLSETLAISNLDDENGIYVLKDTKAKKYFYSLKSNADFTGHLETKLIGEFNAYNALAIYGTAIALGQDPQKVKEEIKKLEPVAGRFQYIKSTKGVTGIVDYAHTPDALENVLKTVNEMKKSGRVISVFGCGGDRDRTKRPIMAKIGYDMSNILILTSDNPRTENPDDILSEMKNGLPSEAFSEAGKVYMISNRHEAIQKACELAKGDDYVLVAGKGHETYQEVDGIKNHFDDLEELKKCFHI